MNSSSLSRFLPMPLPEDSLMFETNIRMIYEELCYDSVELQEEYENMCLSLTEEHKEVQQQILKVVSSESGGVFFLVNKIAGTDFAKCSIEWYCFFAITRRSNSSFEICHTYNIDESSTCHIKLGTDLFELIVRAKLIIWDKALMINKLSFESLHRSLRDIVRSEDGSSSNLPFGGKIIVLEGDFRQILLEHCKVLKLTKNMRLHTGSRGCKTSYDEIAEFVDWILKVGDGNIGIGEYRLNEIEIPEKI
ncbi:hypothetical protein ACS0TY_033277 [Phlomoides rotata]